MIEFIQRFFGRPSSSATAKERLRLVLLSDHISLAPDVVEALKHDLIEVISRYCDVDVANSDVTFEHRDKEIAMLANIPILGMRTRPLQPPPPPSPPPAPPEPVALAVEPAHDAIAAPVKPAAAKPAGATNGQRPTRRKRRKAMTGSKPAPAT